MLARTLWPDPFAPVLAVVDVPSSPVVIEVATTLGLVLLCVLVADFLTGCLHWVEDSYFGPETPIIGRHVIAPNLEHHRDPRAFLRNSWWESTWVSLLIATCACAALWAVGLWHWTVGVTLLIAAHGNTVHKWAHRSRTENGRLIVALQQLRIIQSPAHHAGHHRGDRDRRYCVVSPWMNPIVDGIQLWRRLEWVIQKITGIAKRPEFDHVHGDEHDHEHDHAHSHAQHRAPAPRPASRVAAGLQRFLPVAPRAALVPVTQPGRRSRGASRRTGGA